MVQPIVVCGMGGKNKGQNQLCFVKLGKKKRSKPMAMKEIVKKNQGQNNCEKKKLSFQLLFVGIGRKKQLQNQLQRCWKGNYTKIEKKKQLWGKGFAEADPCQSKP